MARGRSKNPQSNPGANPGSHGATTGSKSRGNKVPTRRTRTSTAPGTSSGCRPSPAGHISRHRQGNRPLASRSTMRWHPDIVSALEDPLLKVEQLHALARDVYYGRRGRSNARELHQQVNSCSCLTLILACIIYWQAKQITQTLRSEAVTKEGLAATLLPARQPDRMGQRHSLRPVRSRSRPGPLRNGSLCCVGSGTGAVARQDLACLYPGFPFRARAGTGEHGSQERHHVKRIIVDG